MRRLPAVLQLDLVMILYSGIQNMPFTPVWKFDVSKENVNDF